MSIAGFTPRGIVYGGTWDGLRSSFGVRYATVISAPASALWPSANLAIAVPYRLDDRITVRRLWLNNGTAVAGNVDIGIYDRSWNLLVSAGSTAQAGTGTLQYFDVTDTVIGPGLIYIAASCSDAATATAVRFAHPVASSRACGIVQMAAALALPATFVPAIMAQVYVPHAGFTTRASP